MTDRYRPNVTVACIVHCNGHFLMVKALIDGQFCRNQPAGHLEANERLLDACRRKVLEETGIQVSPDRLIGIYQFSATTEFGVFAFHLFG